MAFCTECGANVADDIKFCTGCGKPMGEAPAPQPQPQQTIQTVATPIRQTPPVQPAPPPKQQAPAYQSPQQPVYGAAQGDNPPPKGSKYAVMGTLAYIGHFLLFALPIVGLIFAIKWAFSSRINQNRRNLARAMLIFAVIGLIAGVFLTIAAVAWINSLLDYLRETTGEQLGGWQDLFDQFKGIGDQLPSIPTQ
jgi:hypothetical protein